TETLRTPVNSAVPDALLDSYGHDAVDTCAGDSTCMIACPVGIDTGAMMKGFRHQRHSAREERNAARIARAFGFAESSIRAALAVADHVNDRVLENVTSTVRKVISADLIPRSRPEIPGPPPRRLPRTDRTTAAAVYYVACVNRIFADPNGEV